MNGADWLFSEGLLLPAWIGSLVFVFIFASGVLFFPKVHEKLPRFFFPFLLFPALVVSVLFMFRGLEPLDRPIVHWIFHKEVFDSLRIGFVFDSITLIATLVFSVVLLTVCLRNRPRLEIISSLGLAWVGLAVVASSKTFWTAQLGLGIALIAKFIPILFNPTKPDSRGESLDALWMASSKRAWIGSLFTLIGAAGLASHGLHLDFFTEGNWAGLTESPKTVLATVFLFFGLLIHFIPMSTSAVLHRKWSGYLEEENFIFESAGGWISVLIFYRMLPNIRETQWAIGIEGVALFFLALSLIGLSFLETRRSAISFWLANLPLLVLTILPSLHSETAFLFIAGSIIAFSGLFLCLDHTRTRVDLSLVIFFFLGMFGFLGWTNSLPVVEFFSGVEESPVLVSAVLLVWLVFASFGFRIALRGGDSGPRESMVAKWVTSGFLVLLGFGPLLSGRWGSGALPEVVDWLDGAKEWPWIKSFIAESISVSWLGFGLSHAVIILAVLLGVFVVSTSPLFPFAGKFPRGLAAARGLFGGVWIHEKWTGFLQSTGEFLSEKVSTQVWESFLPKVFNSVFSSLRRFGEFTEEKVDVLTSSKFSYLFSAPSKFVQWFHGGNVRLYAWFALGWVLIISIYLTR